jgi:hypothetical protein
MKPGFPPFFIFGLFSSILYAAPDACPALADVSNADFDQAHFRFVTNATFINIDEASYKTPFMWEFNISLYNEYNSPVPDKIHAIEQFKKLFSTVSISPIPKLLTDEWGNDLGYECAYFTVSFNAEISLFCKSYR